MELRSGRRLVYPPQEQQEGVHCRQSQQSSEDRISGLPEHLLLEILIRLGSAAAAVRAGAVCRAWRSLWTELPELTFWYAKPQPIMSALAGITRPSLDLLDIGLMGGWGKEDWAGQISLLLRTAALVLPKKLIICISILPTKDYVVELPCFERTSYLSLYLLDLKDSLPITLPRSGEFTALEILHLEWCSIDLGALLSLCPCLRILNILNINNLRHVDTMIVHSSSLEELGMEIDTHDICRIDIAAPMLQEVTLEVEIAEGFSLSFSAPMVKKLRWGYRGPYVSVGFGQIWRLLSIKERELDEFHVVSLYIMSYANPNDLLDAEAESSITQVIDHLPGTAFSVLELHLETKRHTFGPMMLCLLRIQPTMQRLKVVLRRDKVRVPCPVSCPCEHPINWGSEDVSLANLEVVEIYGLQGEDDEVDFLKIILRCATVLRRLTMTISDNISPSNNVYKKICSIIKEHPDVECHIMASGSDRVLCL